MYDKVNLFTDILFQYTDDVFIHKTLGGCRN